jgi:hypothetical protein
VQQSNECSILTQKSITQIFTTRPTFDLRVLLGGTDRFLDNLARTMNRNAAFFTNSIQCLNLAYSQRSQIGAIMQSASVKDLLYVRVLSMRDACAHSASYSILVGSTGAGQDLMINLVRPRKFILQPADLHIIMNFITSSSSFRSSESWTPICLPGSHFAFLRFLC